jgi:hypothetical protein
MQWETATPVGFPVCMRHNDCRLKKTAVKFIKKICFGNLDLPLTILQHAEHSQAVEA